MAEQTAFVPTSGPQLPATFHEALGKAADYARNEKAEATRRAYNSDFAMFAAWCQGQGVASLPAEPATVVAFLGHDGSRGSKPATIGRRMAAIRYAHKLAGYEPPTNDERVKATVRGLRRTMGVAPAKKAPATAEIVRRMAGQGGDSLKAIRNRALLTLGFGGAFRRSELIALNVEDVELGEKGARVTIRKSKTDQERAGRILAVVRGTTAACPLACLQAWLTASGITSGPVFRGVNRHGQVGAEALSGQAVANIIKESAERDGLDPATFAGHSLRRGFLTSAARQKASLAKMREVSGHKSVDVLMGYIHEAEQFEDHAGAGLL